MQQKLKNKNKQKICIITATYPLDDDYGGIFIADHAKMLSFMGYDVTVLYARPASKLRDSLISCTIIDDIVVYRKDFFSIAATYTVPLLKFGISKCCDALISDYIKDKGAPDIIISHFTYPAGIGASYVSKKYKIPFLTVEHLSLLLDPRKRSWINIPLKGALKQASAVICVSNGLAKGLYKRVHLKNNYYVIPNPIDERFKYHHRENTHPFVFISVGSLRKIKNFDLLIRSFASAFKGNTDVELHIAGTGPLKEELELLVNREGISGQVNFLGQLTREQLRNAYNYSNCFILLSKNETFGVAYREAMATGLPVISSDNYGIRNSWEDKFGVIVDINNKNTIVNAMKALYSQKSFDPIYTSKRMRELYSFEAVGKKYDTIIQKIVSENTRKQISWGYNCKCNFRSK